nr:hypothetical protein BaRGS_031844 [Batillaria attramentaria]
MESGIKQSLENLDLNIEEKLKNLKDEMLAEYATVQEKEFLIDKLELPETVQFDRVHRTNIKPNAPIIARCVLYKDKVSILKARAKLKGSNIFVNEDFSLRVREIRRKLLVHMKEAKAAGKRSILVYDHLVIEGKIVVLVEDGSIREVRGETSD